MSSNSKIQLEFHNTSLTGNEAKIAEKMGMLLLASDFLGSGKVGKSRNLDRISKASISFILSRTKSGDYLAINPYSHKPLKVKLTQLPSLTSITEFVSDPSNLDLRKLHQKMLKFESKETEILGGYGAKDLNFIEKLLQAPKSSRSDFNHLNPVRDQNQIKEDIKSVNQLVYDDKTLDKEINERLDVIEKALKEEMSQYETKYKERESYWQNEIANKNELLQKRLKEREKELDKALKGKEKEIDKKIHNNLEQFRKGVAKNIRQDEKPIEKSIQNLEKLVSKTATRETVENIEKELTALDEYTKIFSEAVSFAKKQVEIVGQKEEDIIELGELEKDKLRKKAEFDKEQLREESKRKEKERDEEMKILKEDRDAVKKRYAKFRDLRDEWVNDIRSEIGKQDTALVPSKFIQSGANSPPKTVQLRIPLYIFQYKKENDHYTLAVPPVIMPDTMRKIDRNGFYGDHKTVYYNLVVPKTEREITERFLQETHSLEFQSSIQDLPNMLDNPADLRDTFFSNSSLMVDKLKVNKKSFKQANDRLTEVFTSG